MGGYISSVFFYQLGIGAVNIVFKIVMKALMQRLYIHYQALVYLICLIKL